MIEIRRAENEDFDQIWTILHEAFLKGNTYAFSPDTSMEEAFHLWVEMPIATYVAVENGLLVGTYFLKPNQPGLGSHVCNAGYVVRSNARGKGIGRLMCEHSLKEASKYGFKAMQYNFVISTNLVAVDLV